MAELPGNVEWVADLVPGLEGRVEQFIVDTEEVDEELIEVFMEELRRLTGELQDGMGASDTDMLRMAAHSIKGMGGTLGLPEISVLGQEIENKAKEEALEEACPLIDALAHWLTTFE
jgi:HPt (histidine-containing phosphotransfer) domain-containing protein